MPFYFDMPLRVYSLVTYLYSPSQEVWELSRLAALVQFAVLGPGSHRWIGCDR